MQKKFHFKREENRKNEWSWWEYFLKYIFFYFLIIRYQSPLASSIKTFSTSCPNWFEYNKNCLLCWYSPSRGDDAKEYLRLCSNAFQVGWRVYWHAGFWPTLKLASSRNLKTALLFQSYISNTLHVPQLHSFSIQYARAFAKLLRRKSWLFQLSIPINLRYLIIDE